MRKHLMMKASHLVIATLIVMPLSSTAIAADDDTTTIEEIIVTAQKRQQSIQEVPIAMSAYDSSFMKKTKIDDVKDIIDFTPGFAGKTKDSFVDAISIRGIQTNSFGAAVDPSIGIFKNGVYQGRTGSAITSFFDIERTEALRGPQGFLFGRNASSGAISTITKRPNVDEVEGYVHVGAGQRNHYELDAAVNIPINENWAVRIAGYLYNEDGSVINHYFPDADKLQSQKKRAARITLGYEKDDFNLTFIAEYESRNQSGTVYRAFDGQGALSIYDVTLRGDASDADSNLRDDKDDGNIYNLTLLMDWDFGDMTFSSITGVRTYDYQYAEDFDGSPLTINHYSQDQVGDYYSQEFRLISSDEGPFTWYAGVSGYIEEIDVSFSQVANENLMCLAFIELPCAAVFDSFSENPDGLVENNDIEGTYKGWGAYIDLTYAVNDKLEISFDLRYTYDKKEFGVNVLPVNSDIGPFFAFGYTTDGFIRETNDWDDFTPRFVIRYAATDDLNLWASVTRGYKAGGFGSFSLDIPTGPGEHIFNVLNEDSTVPDGTRLTSFDPETLWSYEVGLKANLAANRIQMAVNAYYYDFKDLQVTYFNNELLNLAIENVGQVDGYGVEATIRAIPSQYMDIFLGAAYSKTSIEDTGAVCDDCDGNRLSNNPKFTFAGVVNGFYPTENGELFANLEFRYQSRIYSGFENIESDSVKGYASFNLRSGYESNDGWAVSLYIENLFDHTNPDTASSRAYPIPGHLIGVARPRTFGADFTYNFGG